MTLRKLFQSNSNEFFPPPRLPWQVLFNQHLGGYTPPSGARMATPVTGPFTKWAYIKGPPNQFGYMPNSGLWERVSYRQKKPFDRPLPFYFNLRKIVVINNPAEYSPEYTDVDTYPGIISDIDVQRIYNKAYESFMSNVRSAQADVLTLMRERQKSLSMIQNRALQLASFAVAVKRRDLGLAKNVIRNAYTGDRRRDELVAKVGWRKGARSSGGIVLEGAFGWVPLAVDIASAVSVFQKSPNHIAKGSGHLQEKAYHNHGDLPYVSAEVNHRVGWKLRAEVLVVDSDLLLLNSLGLVNLASSVWETTPWSFVVDYFINVQSFLNGFTDRLGLEFVNASSTCFAIKNVKVGYKNGLNQVTPPGGWPNREMIHVTVNREVGIRRPTLLWRAPWSLSPQRALTSIALLLQKLKG